MAPKTPNPDLRDGDDAARLRGLLSPDGISIRLISALAGDRELSAEEALALEDARARRGELFHSDILYAITHQFFAPTLARDLWDEILRHKMDLSRALGRNVRIVVATLDYLSNQRNDIASATVIGEAHMADIADLSMRDGLTGLYNHSSFQEILTLEMRAFARYQTPVSLIMLDLDDFKECNDRHGHQIGDRVLSQLARVLQSQTRDSDICCRYGGEEFAIILPQTVALVAGEIAERIRLRAMEIQAGSRPLTLSAGVSESSNATCSAHDLVAQADRCLFQAKRDGKNRVVTLVRNPG